MDWTLFLQSAVTAGTPVLFGILGGIMCEKVGNMQLGIEGMMLLGGTFGFQAGLASGNPFIAILIAGIAGAAGAMIYALLTVTLRTNHVVTGLILTIFGSGVSGFVGMSLSGKPTPPAVVDAFSPVSVPLLGKIPFIGRVFFTQSPFVLAGMILAVLIYLYFRFTRAGLSARTIGENPAVADSSGINVTLYKYIHIFVGGFLCGVGGSFLTLVYIQRWLVNITAGQGWIAVALIIVSTWNPLKAIAAAYIFGALQSMGFYFQNTVIFGVPVSLNQQFLNMVPYLATILVLVLTTAGGRKEFQGPAANGQAYFREER
jgi:simple sugar transport system permease protein